MKKFYAILWLLLASFAIISCSKQEPSQQTQTNQGVNFAIAPGKSGGLKSIVSTDCFSQTASYVKANIDGKVYLVSIFYVSGAPFTNTIQLSPGIHSLQEFTIWSNRQTPNDSTDDVMLSAVPHSGATYAPYVSSPLNISFSVEAFKKTQLPVEAICYQPSNFTDFGFTFFQIEEVTVREQPFFGDICIQSIADYSIPGSPYLGQSNGVQPDLPAIFKIEVYRNNILVNTFTNEAWKGEGQPLKVQYADRIGVTDNFQFKLYVMVRKGSGFEFVYFHTWTFSDAQVIPSGTDGVVNFALGSCFPQADLIIPFSSGTPTFNTCGDDLTDIRDGKIYGTVLIGNQCWMKENLNYGTRINSSIESSDNGIPEKYCYNDNESNCNIYGGYYRWQEVMQYSHTPGAKGLCPEGWHIPAREDWGKMEEFLGGFQVAGGKLKESGTTHWASPNVGATNSSGFTALPGGFGLPAGSPNTWDYINVIGFFHSSTQYISFNSFYVPELSSTFQGLSSGGTPNTTIRCPVRCLKNDGTNHAPGINSISQSGTAQVGQ
ncbi:MAG: hypothetical protein NTW31_06815, partial [Bacteroidetes bacterium]|nr:hypothetical protein [Bacteroidota bacterium]